MSRPRIVWAAVGLTLLVLIALAVAGAQATPVRTYALGAPNFLPVAHLHPGSHVCEGPVTSDGPAQLVGIWGTPAPQGAQVAVTARDASTHRRLASGVLGTASGAAEHVVRLGRPVPGNRALDICLTTQVGRFTLGGSASIDPRVTMTGGSGGAQFALVLVNDRRSVWSWLGTVFSRAGLWRLSWVGRWTFCVLAAGVLASFGVAILAVVRAAAEDERRP